MMRLLCGSLFVVALTASLPVSGQARFTVQGQTAQRIPAESVPPEVALSLYKTQMIALREEAIDLQRRDGGTLTVENRDAIQSRIDRIERAYHRRVRDFDPYAYRQVSFSQR